MGMAERFLESLLLGFGFISYGTIRDSIDSLPTFRTARQVTFFFNPVKNIGDP